MALPQNANFFFKMLIINKAIELVISTKTQHPESSLLFSLNRVFFCVKGKQSETPNGQMKYGTKVHLESSNCSWCVWQKKVVLSVEAWTAWPTLTEASSGLSAREWLLPQLGYKNTALKLREHLVAKWGVRPQMRTTIFFQGICPWINPDNQFYFQSICI